MLSLNFVVSFLSGSLNALIQFNKLNSVHSKKPSDYMRYILMFFWFEIILYWLMLTCLIFQRHIRCFKVQNEKSEKQQHAETSTFKKFVSWQISSRDDPLLNQCRANLHIMSTYFQCSSQQCANTWKSVERLSFSNDRN